MPAELLDLRQRVRSLLSARAFLVFTVGVLALGLGAATSLFGLLDRLALRPLPYPEPSRLVSVWRTVVGEFEEGQFLGTDFDGVAGAASFEALGMGGLASPVLEGRGDPVTLRGARVTARFLELLRVPPLLGRARFTPEEERFGGPPAAVFTFEGWQRLLGGDPDVVGKAIPLDGRPAVVAGVLPRGFRAPTPRLRGAEVFVPLALTPEERRAGGANFEVVGRLRPGVSPAQAGAELRGLARNLGWGRVGLRVAPLAEGLRRPHRSILALLSTAVALLVLVACANASSLMLARVSVRTTELAVRSALGAAPRVLALQVLVEGALLGLAGLAAGIWLSFALSRLLAAYLGLPDAPPVSGLVLALSGAATLAAVLLAGAVPAWTVARTDPAAVLREGPSRAGRSLGRTALVAGEVALATCLLVGASLLARSLLAQLEADPGLDTEGALVGSLSLPDTLFPGPEARLAFARTLEQRLSALPGVEAAGLALPVPLVDAGGWGVVTEPGTGRSVRAFRHWVSPGAPAALGLRLLSGRPLRDAETGACLVSRPLAAALWPGDDPLGKLLEGTWTVVGLVEGTREYDLLEAPRAQFFIPLDGTVPSVDVVLRTRADPSAYGAELRRVVREVAPRLSLTGVERLEVAVRRNADGAGRSAGLLATFAAAALVLAAAGTYGVLNVLTLRRTREIGVRMSLGARPWQVALLVLGQGLRMAGLGVLAGLAAGTALAGLLRNQLPGVARLDVTTLLGAAALALAATTAACLPPALRAARVDPATALRSE